MFSSIVSKILGIFLERKKCSYGEPNQNSFVGIEMAPFARIQSSTNLLAMVCAAPYLQASQTAPVGILPGAIYPCYSSDVNCQLRRTSIKDIELVIKGFII